MRELDPGGVAWRARLEKLMPAGRGDARGEQRSDVARHVALGAFGGIEQKIADMVEYTLPSS